MTDRERSILSDSICSESINQQVRPPNAPFGDVRGAKPLPKLTEQEFAKFMSRVSKTTSCWLWTGKWTKSGGLRYGIFRVKRDGKWRAIRAHRLFKYLQTGEDNPSLDVHHKCRKTLCVRPAHTEWLSTKEHKKTHTHRRSHCRHGHLFDRSTGRARCNECRKERYYVKRAFDLHGAVILV